MSAVLFVVLSVFGIVVVIGAVARVLFLLLLLLVLLVFCYSRSCVTCNFTYLRSHYCCFRIHFFLKHKEASNIIIDVEFFRADL